MSSSSDESHALLVLQTAAVDWAVKLVPPSKHVDLLYLVAVCHIVAIFYYASTASIVKPCGILILALFGTDYVTPMKSARHVYSVYMTRPNS
eukprot:scaffold93983_cov66-Attheya_sp.AAC.1